MNHLLELIFFNVKARLEKDAVHNFIGYFWWILEPLMLAGIYYIVFDLILNTGEDDYIAFLFVGIIAWKWFASCVQGGASSIFSNKGLYKKIYLPKIIFPWIDIAYYTIKFLVILFFVMALYIFLGFPFTKAHLYLPLVLFCQLVLSIGAATFLASILPYFVDLKIIVGLGLRLLFYPSGVLFNLKRVPEKYQYIVDMNPIAQGIQAFRDIIMYGEVPKANGLMLMFVLGVILYLLGFFIIRKLDRKYAKISV